MPPGVLSRPAQAGGAQHLTWPWVGGGGDHGGGERGGVVRVHQEGRGAAGLGQGRPVGGHDRRAARHRLQTGQAEPLIA